MNARNLLVSVLMLFSIWLSACAPAATHTSIPPTTAPTNAPVQGQTIFLPKTFNLPITFRYGSDWKNDEENPARSLLPTKTMTENFS